MHDNIFGSVLDLGMLLESGTSTAGEDDAFLKDFGGSLADLEGLDLPKCDLAEMTCSTASQSGCGQEASNDEADTFPSGHSSMQLRPDFPPAQVWPVPASLPPPFKQTSSPESQPNPAALLAQLLSVIQTSAPPKAETILQQETMKSQSTQMPATSKPAPNMSLPSLTAPQQRALQTIMSLGSLGTTPEGKKVRRMLSNRESARRSRHRKQAHVHTLEEKVHAVEVENQSLKASLSRLTAQEMLHSSERLQLQAEIATLHNKIARMEQAGSCGAPLKGAGTESDISTKGGSLSFDSCYESRPGARKLAEADLDHCSKKQRT